jgi:hypothetical protein
MPELLTRQQYLAEHEARNAAFAASIQPTPNDVPAVYRAEPPVKLTLVDTQPERKSVATSYKPAPYDPAWEQQIGGGWVIRIECENLANKQVILCGEDADIDLWRMEHPGVDSNLPVYRGRELLVIAKQGCPGKLLNEVKSVIGGRLLADDEIIPQPSTAKSKKK